VEIARHAQAFGGPRSVRECLPGGQQLDVPFKDDLGMGHGDANTLVHHTLKSDGASAAAAAGKGAADVLNDIYTGPKAALRPIHDALMAAIEKFGPFEIAPKKGYVSLRGKKQFAMIGPATNTQVEVGLNMKGVKGTSRLIEQKPGGMCQYKVRVGDGKDVDKELLGWIRQAYDGPWRAVASSRRRVDLN
jgi:hypothetical protein